MRCKSGKRCLMTCVRFAPDNQLVENFHQHIRDLKRLSRTMVCRPSDRTRACIDNGVLEERNTPHRRVTREDFMRVFHKRRRQKNAWRVNPVKVKLRSRWMRITQRRTWQSTTPESFRSCLAGWRWARTWAVMPPVGRPKLKAARCSCLLPLLKVTWLNSSILLDSFTC